MTQPTPTAPALRPVTLHLRSHAGEVVGAASIRLVLPLRNIDDPLAAVDLTAWAITHALDGPAGGTHTEVAFPDHPTGLLVEDEDGAPYPPERQQQIADHLVQQAADLLYARTWAYHYRPEQVADSVLRYGSLLRERVEVTKVELWGAL